MFVIFCFKCINQQFLQHYKKKREKQERILSSAGVVAPFARLIVLFSLAFAQGILPANTYNPWSSSELLI